MSARAGLNVFAFNYRGVGYSTGFPHSAEDLVQDGLSCLTYLTSSLSARHEHVLLFGHSLGGAIAPLVRAESPAPGPVVSERSFCSLGAAAKSVLTSVLHSITGLNIPLPVALVQGLLNSVFKGHLDVVAALRQGQWPLERRCTLEPSIYVDVCPRLHEHTHEARGINSVPADDWLAAGDILDDKLIEERGITWQRIAKQVLPDT